MKSSLAALAILLGILGYLIGTHIPSATPIQENQRAQTFGSVTPVGATQFTLAGAGINSTQTTIQLASFTTPDGRALTMSMFGTIGYGALEPQTTAKIEDITFTGIVQNSNGTATLTGVTRGNDFVTPYAATASLAHAHAGGSTFILTNTAGFYSQFYSLNNVATSTNTLIFSSTTPPRYDFDPVWASFSTTVLASVAYVNSVVAAGAANASETVKGIIELATGSEAALGTSLGGTGARLVVPNSLATSTPYSATPAGSFPTSNAIGGKISQLWLDLTANWTFTGALNIAASVAKPLTLNALAYVFPTSNVAGGLQNNGSGTLSWASNMTLLTSTTTTAAMNFATTTFAAASNLHVIISIPSMSAVANQVNMRFNGDSASNYASSGNIVTAAGANSPSAVQNATTINLIPGFNGTTTPQMYTINIQNVATQFKMLTYSGILSGHASLPLNPVGVTGGGVWVDTSNQITTMVFGTNGATTFGVGTKIYVYGSSI